MTSTSIPNTNLEISPITLGTWVFGGDFWGGGKEDEAVAAVQTAIESGITCIDTAPLYSNGVSERIVGKALKGKRDQVTLATKCGLTLNGTRIVNNLTPKSIYQEMDESLKRLQTDYIDIYQCHWPDEATPVGETLEALNKLKEQGKIRHIGLSNYSVAQFEEALKYADIVTSQNEYSILRRDVEKELLPFLKEKQIGLLAYGPLAGGILTGKYGPQPDFAKSDARSFFYKFYEGETFNRVSSFVHDLRELNHPLSQLAINWLRAQEGVTTVLVGCRNPEQVRDNAAALTWELTESELKTINGLLTAKAHG